ncbi:MAG: ribose 5-phosphate isomerase B [Chloroflexi bacterium]|nr:ribose 5-phosphate isomerase B [Chloroflexota bacterium]
MKLAIGCDNAGAPLLDVVRDVLKERGIEFEDYGVGPTDPTMYPDVARSVSEQVASGTVDRGILVCGTGIGMSITANKVPGVRAALVHDTYSAERAQLSNDAQIITMGARVIGGEVGRKIVETWLDAQYIDNERSGPKVKRMIEIDEEYRGKMEAAGE